MKNTKQLTNFFIAASILFLLPACQNPPSGKTPGGVPQHEENDKLIDVPPFNSQTASPIPSLQEAGLASEPAFFDDFDPGWNETQEDWLVASWTQNGAQMDPSRCRTNDQGHLIQTVKAGMPYRGGSLETKPEFGWGRWLARVKPSNVPGALHSIFVKDWDNRKTELLHDGMKSEVDFEFLTYTFSEGRGKVHIAIHLLHAKPLLGADVELDFNPSDDFNIWGFDILPDRVIWHVNGKHIHTWFYTEKDYIDPAYEMYFNSWTLDEWIMGPPKMDSNYAVDWVKFYPLQK